MGSVVWRLPQCSALKDATCSVVVVVVSFHSVCG